MRKPSRAEFTPLDFEEWRAGGTLALSPKFQRRKVWTSGARSFFIDSLLRGMPVPPIYVRQTQSPERDRIIREVVDGQQRISAVLDYIAGKYRLSRTLNAHWAGQSYGDLPQAEQDLVSTYAFSVEVFHGISDLDVLEIFSRLNTYSVSLNNQELRNGKYFGFFKQSVYGLAYEHLEFWRRHRIFTEQSIARMLEAEFVSEAIIAFMDGMQDKKKSIESYYADYDQTFDLRAEFEKRFRTVVDTIDDALGDELKDSSFRRPPLLYTLFCVVYHRRYGLPGQRVQTPQKRLTVNERLALREAVELLSESIELGRAEQPLPAKHTVFVGACLRQTDNIKPRQIRFDTLYKTAFG